MEGKIQLHKRLKAILQLALQYHIENLSSIEPNSVP
jgi:hypothetical protein